MYKLYTPMALRLFLITIGLDASHRAEEYWEAVKGNAFIPEDMRTDWRQEKNRIIFRIGEVNIELQYYPEITGNNSRKEHIVAHIPENKPMCDEVKMAICNTLRALHLPVPYDQTRSSQNANL